MMMTLSDFSFIAPECVLFGSAIVILLMDCWLPSGLKWLNYLLAQFSILLAALLASKSIHLGEAVHLFENHVTIDALGSLLKVGVYLVVFAVFFYGRHYIQSRGADKGEHYVLALFSTLGMSFLINANTLLMLYMGLELFSLPLYALIAMQQSHTYSSEASMKYFVMGGIASGMLLYGMSLLFGLSNSIVLADVAAAFPAGTMIGALAVVMMAAAVAFKLGAVPFHMWVPDVYEGAPTDVAAFIASAAKIAAFGLCYRLLIETIPQLSPEWSLVFLGLALLSLALGNIVAIAQTNVKRLLAYSTIAHVSFVLLGFVAGLNYGGVTAALFYVLVYALTTVGAFGVLLNLSSRGVECENIEDLKGLSQTHPWTAFLMLILVFSLAGVPPTVGFYAKLMILQSLIDAQLWVGAIAAMLFSVVGAFYYLRLVRIMYFDSPEAKSTLPVKQGPGLGATTLLSVNALLALILGLAPVALFSICQSVFA
jgi:NADH-quinone oxidoreductase subunit N